MPGMNELELRVAWERHVGAAGEWFDAVLDHHREPHRRYHAVHHVQWVVRHALELAARPDVAGRIDDLGAVIAAAFFHDAIYDPGRGDNEAASAALATRALAEIGWGAARIATVADLVLATAEHRSVTPPGAALDTAVLLAADLAVLAADPAGYAEYVTGVRGEYAHVSDADWRLGRGALLRGLIERAAIYDPALGLDAWERRARANLAAELSTLTDVSGE